MASGSRCSWPPIPIPRRTDHGKIHRGPFRSRVSDR
jgi:hypothetical protein